MFYDTCTRVGTLVSARRWMFWLFARFKFLVTSRAVLCTPAHADILLAHLPVGRTGPNWPSEMSDAVLVLHWLNAQDDIL